ncbi:dTDP-4-keto-6-deoxy-D-glucose epimerase [Thalassospira sp. ER-Se-21-Dark]|nr:dTDP-4-keto-6-deoxy-D-glucose epimerase [Thalassospira sp. ER-Se-21-Dark]
MGRILQNLVFEDTCLTGLKTVERKMRSDTRGFLSRLFCAEELLYAGWRKPIAQVNHVRTKKKGAIRGMHFQFPPHAEMKLVTCVKGAVVDVAVDLRAGSPTFLKWYMEKLSAVNGRALLIPEGFAHGYQTIDVECELVYLHSAGYEPAAEGGVNPFDPTLSISWPLQISEISERDRNHTMIDESFKGIQL